MGRQQEFLTSSVVGIRVSPIDPPRWLGKSRARDYFEGHLLLEAGSRSVRFGGGLSETEAAWLVIEIAERFPQVRAEARHGLQQAAREFPAA